MYDADVNTFTPEGRILQLEYAIEASKQGATSIGICTAQGVILAAEKRQTSPLMVARGLDRIVLLDNHIACTMAGMTADARSLIEPALMACTEHFLTYSEYIPMETLVESVARQATNFGKGGDASSGDSDTDSDSDYDCDSDSDSYDGNTQPPATARPYGVALLFAGVVKGQPQLWHLDPTGDFQHIGAKAIGSGGDSAQLKLLEHYKAAMQLNEAKFLALSILQGIIGQKLTSSNVEVMVVTQEELCHKLRKAELEQEIATLPSNTEGGDAQ